MADRKLWSVTTLIKMGLGTSEPLVNWAVRTTAEAAFTRNKMLQQYIEDKDVPGGVEWLADQRWQSSGQAAARGTDLHVAAEALALGKDPKVEPHVQPFLDQYLLFLKEYRPTFLMAEAPVYNPTHGYAGTLDGIMTFPWSDMPDPLVADIKTTKWGPNDKTPAGNPRSRPPFPEVALQLVAYRRAEVVGLLSERREAGGKRYYMFDPDRQHEPMPETAGAVCVAISAEDYTVTMIRTDDLVWKAFRHTMECARWQNELSQVVIGRRLAPAPKEAT